MKAPRFAPVILLRIAAPIFAAVALAAFVWYSQVRAQRPVMVAPQAEQAPRFASPLVFSGSKSFSGPVIRVEESTLSVSKPATDGARGTIMLGSKSGRIDVTPINVSAGDRAVQSTSAPKTIPQAAPIEELSDPFAKPPSGPTPPDPFASKNASPPDHGTQLSPAAAAAIPQIRPHFPFQKRQSLMMPFIKPRGSC